MLMQGLLSWNVWHSRNLVERVVVIIFSSLVHDETVVENKTSAAGDLPIANGAPGRALKMAGLILTAGASGEIFARYLSLSRPMMYPKQLLYLVFKEIPNTRTVSPQPSSVTVTVAGSLAAQALEVGGVTKRSVSNRTRCRSCGARGPGLGR